MTKWIIPASAGAVAGAFALFVILNANGGNISVTIGDFFNKSESNTLTTAVPEPTPVASAEVLHRNEGEVGVTESLQSTATQESVVAQASPDEGDGGANVYFGPKVDDDGESRSISGFLGQSTNPAKLSLGGPSLPDSFEIDGLNGVCAYDCKD